MGDAGDGLYDLGRTSYLALPPFDASGYGKVYLQFWRQLLNADVASIEVNGSKIWENIPGAFYWREPQYQQIGSF